MTPLDFMFRAVVIGVTATIVFDVWNLFLHRVLQTPNPDWGLLGRWVRHAGHGVLMHQTIREARAFPGEARIGWLAHYVTGVAFAALLLLAAGPDWARNPTLIPALAAGLATLIPAWFLLMPAFGHGFAASRSLIANKIRTLNIVGHLVLGLGFYAGALLSAALH